MCWGRKQGTEQAEDLWTSAQIKYKVELKYKSDQSGHTDFDAHNS